MVLSYNYANVSDLIVLLSLAMLDDRVEQMDNR
jgi:hypothetical protein